MSKNILAKQQQEVENENNVRRKARSLGFLLLEAVINATVPITDS